MGSGQHELIVHSDVVIHGVTEQRGAVVVDVLGGPDNVCGSVRLHGVSRQTVRMLRQWSRQGTPVQVECDHGTVTFQLC